MSYLTNEAFQEIYNNVKICSIMSKDIKNINNYLFETGEAKEYELFLKQDAKILEEKCITKTFLIIHKVTDELIGYFTLSCDAVKLTNSEKSDSKLDDVAYRSLPAIKVGKLAINKSLSEEVKRKGYGSFALDIANTYAFEALEIGIACRFLTVDADIEYDKNTPEFYLKNGFEYNLSVSKSGSSKTVSMRRDIFH